MVPLLILSAIAFTVSLVWFFPKWRKKRKYEREYDEECERIRGTFQDPPWYPRSVNGYDQAKGFVIFSAVALAVMGAAALVTLR